MSGLIEGTSSGSTQVHKSDPYKRNTLPLLESLSSGFNSYDSDKMMQHTYKSCINQAGNSLSFFVQLAS